MKSKRAQLQLRFFGVDRVRVEPNEAYKPSEALPTVCPDITIGVQEGPAENECTVAMEVSIQEGADLAVPIEAVPYFLAIRAIGLFKVDAGLDDKTRFWLMQMNAPAILYGLARAEVCHLTERNRYGHFLLPCVDFIGMAREMLEAAEQKKQESSE